MTPTVNAKTVTRNVGWSVLSKTGTFGLKFVTVPILARILSPEEFGTVAVALTVVQFLAMIGGAGLPSALVIQHGLRFDETLRIGEDYILLASALACGGRCAVEPSAGYIYHIREGSISRVLRLEHIDAMDDAFAVARRA